jgi:DNA-binding HxlR family transcriptional regulator
MASPKYIRTCSIWRSLEIVGDKPSLLLLESYWLGTRRFSAFQKQTGLLKTVVSDRLAKLVAAGCFEKVLYSERPKRFEYRGTQKFYDLYPIALSMLHWEQKWGATDGKIQLSLVHKNCGQITQPHAVCGDCKIEVDARDVSWSEGPGVGLMPAEYSRRRRKETSVNAIKTPLFDEIADLIGDRWSTLIMRSVFTNLNSYQDICEDTAMATNVLAERLTRLCATGFLQKKDATYRLTEKGRGIYPILLALMEWGDKWYADPEGPPLILTHKPCGNALKSAIICPQCGENVTKGDIRFEFIQQTETADP